MIIIDPTSPEFNRGSFCYLPYLLAGAAAEKGELSRFYENFTTDQIDDVDPTEDVYVALWSYPQIEACRVLEKFLPNKNVYFFGYYPLIDTLGLRKYTVSNDDILLGMLTYPKNYMGFRYLLLSDCDMHLKKYEGQVYPMFTSYGCPRGCAFCPTSVNTNRTRIELPTVAVEKMLLDCIKLGITNIHFTDEDFFFDPGKAHEILDIADRLKKRYSHNFNFITLGGVSKVLKYMEVFGQDTLSSTVRLIEVGFETGDEDLAKAMGKPSKDKYTELALKSNVDIFWLTLTFFPGETISTLRKTGEFLRQFGFAPHELYGRIRTNGTPGGLGQFFQAYHGTVDYDQLEDKGHFLTRRPLRLVPSYIPNSFLDCRFRSTLEGPIPSDLWYYLNLYRVAPPGFAGVVSVRDLIKNATRPADVAVSLAICARLGYIQEV